MNPLPVCPRLLRKHPIYVEQIALLEGCGNYTLVHLLDGSRVLLSKNIGLLDSLLPSEAFVRLNKTYTISHRVVQDWSYNAQILTVKLANDLTVEVARRRVAAVKKSLMKLRPR